MYPHPLWCKCLRLTVAEHVGESGNRDGAVDAANVDLAVALVHHEAAVRKPQQVEPVQQRRTVDHVQSFLRGQDNLVRGDLKLTGDETPYRPPG